jgi:CheY-like chemotaxis protein
MTINTGPILVVEDISAVRELVEVQLKMRGYRVQTARDGQDALRVMAAERPAVIVTDILMPRMDGFALAHVVRLEPQTAGVPIIFMSATYVTAEDEQFALTLGAYRFLPKPVDSDELFVAVSDALTGQQRRGAPMPERSFYTGYRERLQNKLSQKAAQVARSRQHMENLPPDQRDTYQRLVAEAQGQYVEIEHELTVLSSLLKELGS